MEILNGITMGRRRFSALAISRRVDPDVKAYIDQLEAAGRTITYAERIALNNDKKNGIAAGWYNKMYDRVLLGWADADANAVRQIALTDITFTAPTSHSNAGYVDFAGGGYALPWTPANAYSSVNGIGVMIGVVGSSSTGSATIDIGVIDGANSELYFYYAFGVVDAILGSAATALIRVGAPVNQAEGFYLAQRTSASSGRVRSYIASTLATVSSSSGLSGGALPAIPMALGANNNYGTPIQASGRKYSQLASYDGLTNTEADDALIDAMALEIALGWRSP